MVFDYILDNAEPFALDLDRKPWRVSVRAQVVLGFVALGLGKGGLFISTFLFAMAWSEDGWLGYAISCTIVTLAVMIAGYIITFGRIVVEIDPQNATVRLTKRIPFHRRTHTVALRDYGGVALTTDTDRDQRTTHTLYLAHKTTPDLNAPLWQRRHPERPDVEQAAFAQALGCPALG